MSWQPLLPKQCWQQGGYIMDTTREYSWHCSSQNVCCNVDNTLNWWHLQTLPLCLIGRPNCWSMVLSSFPPLCPRLDLPPINNAWKQLQKECAIFRYILLQQKISAQKGPKQSPIFEGFYGTKADLNLDPHLAVWLKGCQNIALLNLWPDRWSFMQT